MLSSLLVFSPPFRRQFLYKVKNFKFNYERIVILSKLLLDTRLITCCWCGKIERIGDTSLDRLRVQCPIISWEKPNRPVSVSVSVGEPNRVKDGYRSEYRTTRPAGHGFHITKQPPASLSERTWRRFDRRWRCSAADPRRPHPLAEEGWRSTEFSASLRQGHRRCRLFALPAVILRWGNITLWCLLLFLEQ
jgi:hypothetical protein